MSDSTALDDLIGAYLDGAADQAGVSELEARLRSDRAAAHAFVRAARFDQTLYRLHALQKQGRAAGAVSPAGRFMTPVPRRAVAPKKPFFPLRIAIAGAAAVLLAFAAWRFGTRSDPQASQQIGKKPSPSPTPAVLEDFGVARLGPLHGNQTVRITDAAGSERSAELDAPLRTGDTLRLADAADALEIRFLDGTRMQISNAAELQIVQAPRNGERAAKRLLLSAGRLEADVPPQPAATPLTIDTPLARATVLGTRFTLTAINEATRLEVAAGRVKLERKLDAARIEVDAGHYAEARETARLAAVPLGQPLPPGRDYYLSPNGMIGAPASAARPAREVQELAASLKSGDTVHLAPGTYQAFLLKDVQGSAEFPILLCAKGGPARIEGSLRDDARGMRVRLDECKHLTLQGLEIEASDRLALQIINGSHITLRDSAFRHGAKALLSAVGCDDLKIERCEFSDVHSASGACSLEDCQRPFIVDSRFFRNPGAALQLAGGDEPGMRGAIRGARIERNILAENGRSGGAALNLDGIHEALVRNNLLYANRASGIAVYRDGSRHGPREVRVLNNTVVSAPGGRYALRLADLEGPVFLRNNLLVGGNDSIPALGLLREADLKHIDSDANLFAGPRLVAIDDIEPAAWTLEEWQRKGHDARSRSADPGTLFLNAPAHDYRLAPQSPARDAGDDALITTNDSDLDGRPRKQGDRVDLGCYEAAP